AGGQVTPVSVSIASAKLFMEARSLSYASPKSIIGKTTAGGQVTPVSVSIASAKLFMEARSLSYASPKSIILPKPIFKPTPVPYQRVLNAVKDVAIASRWGVLGLLFHSEPAGDPNKDQLFIRKFMKLIIFRHKPQLDFI
ncbi:hypothetical protein, partial [Shigella sp. FC1967]|uniref:hypothetical protein n=1 Tax=Shigella sp. FC1967 TaxID=1898041 RepID=UPI001C0A6856